MAISTLKPGYVLRAALLVIIIEVMHQATASILSGHCYECTDADRAKCPVLQAGPDCELIDEPNCGCCKMCAKKPGQRCGAAEGYCDSSSKCSPAPLSDEDYEKFGFPDYYTELSEGRFVCITNKELLEMEKWLNETYGDVDPAPYDGEYDNADNVDTELQLSNEHNAMEESRLHNGHTETTESNTDKSHLNPFIPKLWHISEPLPPTAPFQKAEQPCLKHSQKVWQKLHFDKHEWIPCCRGGDYMPEQCELSFGFELGRCWCVDPLGNPVSGYNARDESSGIQCSIYFNGAK